MTFLKNVIQIGRGSVSSARADKGAVRIALKEEGFISLKLIREGKRQAGYAPKKILSYSDECLLLSGGRVERREELSYVPNE